MMEVAVYLVIVLLIGGLGIWIGMILARRIDQRMTPPDAEPPAAPTEEQS